MYAHLVEENESVVELVSFIKQLERGTRTFRFGGETAVEFKMFTNYKL